MTTPRSRPELERDFSEAFHRLFRAGETFDSGGGFEAANIASCVYIFVHDASRKLPSLLSMLNLKDDLKFLDTARELNSHNLLCEHPLVLVRLGSGASGYIARKDEPLGLPPKQEFFSKWWEKPVFRDVRRRVFSRKNLITLFRHDRGGGHVARQYQPRDGIAAEALADASAGNADGWSFRDSRGVYSPPYPIAYASVRQIGWELEQTLRNNFHDLISPK